MHVIFARNVNDAYAQGLRLIADQGQHTPSRNGHVLRLNRPVTTCYQWPTERVLFDAQRDCNPFFHLFEALWMLNGQNDVQTLAPFLRSFAQFSDDGETFHGAYGHRWRRWPIPSASVPGASMDHTDQLTEAVNILRDNPQDRRVVITMWDPNRDLGHDGKDVPCNLVIKPFVTSDQRLDIQVFCRSNDMIWGAYGANAVHMSFLQEYLAARCGLSVGTYYQISGDAHAYDGQPYRFDQYYPQVQQELSNPYLRKPTPMIIPLVHDAWSFDSDLRYVMRAITMDNFNLIRDLTDYDNHFFPTVVTPMYRAHLYVRQRRYAEAIAYLEGLDWWDPDMPIDWFLAAIQWCQRRIARQAAR